MRLQVVVHEQPVILHRFGTAREPHALWVHAELAAHFTLQGDHLHLRAGADGHRLVALHEDGKRHGVALVQFVLVAGLLSGDGCRLQKCRDIYF